MKIKYLSDFLNGAGQFLDICGRYDEHIIDKYLNTPSEKLDKDALQSDWQAVGNDMKNAMGLFDTNKNEK